MTAEDEGVVWELEDDRTDQGCHKVHGRNVQDLLPVGPQVRPRYAAGIQRLSGCERPERRAGGSLHAC